MKVRNKKLLIIAIVVLVVITAIYNLFRIYTCSYLSISDFMFGRIYYYYGTLKWFPYFYLFRYNDKMIFFINSLICLIAPIITILGLAKNRKKISLFTLGTFYTLEAVLNLSILFNILHWMSILTTHDRYLQFSLECALLLCTSIITAVSLCLLAVNKINRIDALICSLTNPICSIVFILNDVIKALTMIDPSYRSFRIVLPLLSLSIYILTICVVCYYIDPKEKPRNAITSTYFDYKNIAVSIVLSIVTFGIYTIVWLVDVVRNTHKLHGVNKTVTGEVLLILFIPFYSWYWFYTRGKQMFEESRRVGGNMPDYSVLYLVLAIFGLGLINLAVMQNCFNKYAVGVTVPQTQPQMCSGVGNRLQELQGLANQGLITPEEYESKRKDILNKL